MTARQPSIQRRLMVWLLGALCAGSFALVGVAYRLTLFEIDEVFVDGLRRTALLLASRDFPAAVPASDSAAADDASDLIAIARGPDGSLLFASDPRLVPGFDIRPGASRQMVSAVEWHVYTVVGDDRIVQVAQPTSVGREEAAEAAWRLLVPLVVLIGLTALLLMAALRRGLRPLHATSAALAQRSAASLAPLETRAVPVEVLPLVHAQNDLLQRLGAAFEAQRRFVAEAAHELRSPIAALQLQAQLLERSSDEAARREAMRELGAGIARARRLAEQLLYLSRASAADAEGVLFQPTGVDLGALARDAVVRWSAEARRRGIDLGVKGDTLPVRVEGDAAQLERLLDNLIENALRYGRPRGVVDVVASHIGGVPALQVIDDGPGIADAEKSRVFDRFYRSPRAAAGAEPGSGLGLAIVLAIAQRHAAQISLNDRPGRQGLEVRVLFAAPPQAQGTAANPRPPQDVAGAPRNHRAAAAGADVGLRET